MSYLIVHLQNVHRIPDEYLGRSELYLIFGNFYQLNNIIIQLSKKHFL